MTTPMTPDRLADLRFLAGHKFDNAIGDPIGELLAEVDRLRAEEDQRLDIVLCGCGDQLDARYGAVCGNCQTAHDTPRDAEVDRLRAEHQETLQALKMANQRTDFAHECLEGAKADVDRLETDNADLRLQVEGWRRTATELTDALREHTIDWGICGHPDDTPCPCSHARALALLDRESEGTAPAASCGAGHSCCPGGCSPDQSHHGLAPTD